MPPLKSATKAVVRTMSRLRQSLTILEADRLSHLRIGEEETLVGSSSGSLAEGANLFEFISRLSPPFGRKMNIAFPIHGWKLGPIHLRAYSQLAATTGGNVEVRKKEADSLAPYSPDRAATVGFFSRRRRRRRARSVVLSLGVEQHAYYRSYLIIRTIYSFTTRPLAHWIGRRIECLGSVLHPTS